MLSPAPGLRWLVVGSEISSMPARVAGPSEGDHTLWGAPTSFRIVACGSCSGDANFGLPVADAFLGCLSGGQLSTRAGTTNVRLKATAQDHLVSAVDGDIVGQLAADALIRAPATVLGTHSRQKLVRARDRGAISEHELVRCHKLAAWPPRCASSRRW